MSASPPRVSDLPFVKGHAYGNDFLLVEQAAVSARPLDAIARAICDRHRGIGADGLIAYRRTGRGAAMTLHNADGSVAEVSGNGVRCLAAWLVADGAAVASTDAADLVIETAGGIKRLTLLEASPPRYTFRATMGEPDGLGEETITVDGEAVRIVVLSVGNPQCIVLTPTFAEAERAFARFGARLATHERFPAGTNVEFVTVERPDRVRILIWERGVGPTSASGTGACASAVAAARYGGADRRVEVVSPGGTQEVTWDATGITLTGWADLVADGRWRDPPG